MEDATSNIGVEVPGLWLGALDAGGTAPAVTLVDPPCPEDRLSRGWRTPTGGSPIREIVTCGVGDVRFGRRNRSSIRARPGAGVFRVTARAVVRS
jgi:hypothetical protein